MEILLTCTKLLPIHKSPHANQLAKDSISYGPSGPSERRANADDLYAHNRF